MINNNIRFVLIAVIVIVIVGVTQKTESSQESLYPQNAFPSDFGEVGLIQAPTARFTEDGTLTFGVSSASPYNRMYLSMTFLPWLEAGLFYTETSNRLYSTSSEFSGNQTAKDKGFNLKIKLAEEGKILPQIAIGFRDVAGTGKFGGEYIVASKAWENFDFTLGLGYGYLGTQENIKNPFGLISDSFKNRPRPSGGGLGGTLNIETWFKGNKVSLFGGVQYQTKIPNLSLKLEYDPNDYQSETSNNNQDVDSAFNVGINYLLLDKFYISANFERGNVFSFNLAKPMNFSKQFGPEKYNPPSENVFARNKTSFSDFADNNLLEELVDTIITQMGNEGLATHSVTFDDDEIIVDISQRRFRPTIYAVDLASRILAYNAPSNIKILTVNNVDFGIQTFSSSIERQDLINYVSQGPLEADAITINNNHTLSNQAVVFKNKYMYPNFAWQIIPTVRTVLGGPDDFLLWQLQARFRTVTSFRRDLYLETEIHKKVKDNFDKWKLNPTSGTLHHVRSDQRKFWQIGDPTLARMQLDYLFRMSPNIIGRFSGGILEEMFGGVGGELLYMQPAKPWAIGIDVYWAKQREYNQKFSFQEYETTTGHLTFYYDLPFYNLQFMTSVGKYLAKDTGITIDISRRYNNGVRIGARAAFTSASAEEYGEGSFGKWIYGSVPLDIFSNTTTKDQTFLEWAPLTRDGGIKLKTGKNLYFMVTNPSDELDAASKTPKKYWTMKKVLSGFNTSGRKS